MPTTFPDAWSSLAHPYKRAELLEYLRDISAMTTGNSDLDIDDVFHFFFDDTDLGENPSAEVGFMLFDESEAVLIKSLCAHLDEMLKRLGDKSSDNFVRDPLWKHVVLAAEAANSAFIKMGLPSYQAA